MGKRKRKKMAKKVEDFIVDREIDPDDVVMAGLGTLAKATKKGKKHFKKAVKRGRKVAGIARESTAEMMTALTADDPDEITPKNPVIAYRPTAGGWYDIEIEGTVVETIQGEDGAAKRAGDLLAAFAALEPEEQERMHTGIVDHGGGWYLVSIAGVPVDRVRGKETAEERFAEVCAGRQAA